MPLGITVIGLRTPSSRATSPARKPEHEVSASADFIARPSTLLHQVMSARSTS
jgi:hypothetical protein